MTRGRLCQVICTRTINLIGRSFEEWIWDELIQDLPRSLISTLLRSQHEKGLQSSCKFFKRNMQKRQVMEITCKRDIRRQLQKILLFKSPFLPLCNHLKNSWTLSTNILNYYWARKRSYSRRRINKNSSLFSFDLNICSLFLVLLVFNSTFYIWGSESIRLFAALKYKFNWFGL